MTAAVAGLGFLSLDRNLQLGEGDVWVMACAFFYALHIISVSHFATTP
ncbi:MAG: hypothetical protein M5R40_16510 [Anaerolineae bacterium]|nr:hypothetical protein [Anaerolineae bacterium]